MALYGIGAAWEVTEEAGPVTGAGRTVTGAAGVVNGATGAGAMAVGEDVPLAVTAVLARPVVELPP